MIKGAKYSGLVMLFLMLALSGAAQTNGTGFRLAIISEVPAAGTLVDLLTVELSSRPQIQLLERAQIEKILREQALSANNQDFVKLGQVLGAEGMLLLSAAAEGTNRFLLVRLMAVKPGVVIASTRAQWPVPDSTEWAKLVSRHFDPLLPKLAVSAKDAVPVSVINLRSAVKSRASEGLERQLTVLAIERLTHERDVFVLERRRMELLVGEKELQGMGESQFWNGSYLLEGTIDRDGYSSDRITIHARLIPPRGGTPVEFAAEGPRAELSVVVSDLAERLVQLLNRKSAPDTWKPEAEAERYFAEAKWARKWGMIESAQAAGEAAWALGKQDVECANERIQAWVVDSNQRQFLTQRGSRQFLSATDPRAQQVFSQLADARIPGAAIQSRGIALRYLVLAEAPNPRTIEPSLRALELHVNVSRDLRRDQFTSGSPWVRTGIDALNAASRILEIFHLLRSRNPELEEQLVLLRSQARQVADWIESVPAVQDGYWVGDRVVDHDQLGDLQRGGNIFWSAVANGSLWQEKPEDCVAIYRRLMSSPVFGYLHKEFWFRPPERPRIVVWNARDQARVAEVWGKFLEELAASTNQLLRLEGLCLRVADAETPDQLEASYKVLFDGIFANSDVFVKSNVELLYLEWGLGRLLQEAGKLPQTASWSAMSVMPDPEQLRRRYRTEYAARLGELNNQFFAYNRERAAQRKEQGDFQAQLAYLRTNGPTAFVPFATTFRFDKHTPAQAAELLPLLANYQSNLVFSMRGLKGVELTSLMGLTSHVAMVEQRLRDAAAGIKQPTPNVVSKAVPASLPVVPTVPTPVQNSVSSSPAISSLVVRRYIKFPFERLQPVQIGRPVVNAHGFRDGRLLLDLKYSGAIDQQLWGDGAAAFTWREQDNGWDVVPHPSQRGITPFAARGRGEYETGLACEYFKGDYYFTDREGIIRVAGGDGKAERLEIPGGSGVLFFIVHDRLFAANDAGIFEILDQGRRAVTLASRRRMPAVTLLDRLENFGVVTLFPGPQRTLRANIGTKIYSWNGNDWREIQHPALASSPLTYQEGPFPRRTCEAAVSSLADSGGVGTILRSDTDLWLLPHDSEAAERCWRTGAWDDKAKPTWENAPELPLVYSPGAIAGSNLVFITAIKAANQVETTDATTNSFHAQLVWLDRQFRKPIVLPVRFDNPDGVIPDVAVAKTFDGEGPNRLWLVAGKTGLIIGHSRMPGLWLMAWSEIEPVLARERAKYQTSQSLAADTLRDDKTRWLQKYDLNHNKRIDPEEKAGAIDDPNYLKGVLEEVDLNRNGVLEPDEFRFFDANGNQTVEPAEESAVKIVRDLMADRLFGELDTDHDGLLQPSELGGSFHSRNPHMFAEELFPYSDKDRNERINPKEFVTYLNSKLADAVIDPFLTRKRFDLIRQAPAGTPPDTWKYIVETHWNSSSALTNRPAQAGNPGNLPSNR